MAENKFDLKSLVILASLLALVVFFFLRSGPEAGNISIEARQIARSCKALDNKESCYAKAFENLTIQRDWNHSFAVLRELQRIEPESRGCHFIAHSITIAETRKDPSKWREIMNTAPQDCSYGAAHGALEVYASTFPGGKLPDKEIPQICSNPDTNNCTHILGHLLLIMTENNIPESLEHCERLPHNDFAKFECLTGVFMERITAFNLETHGLAGKEALDWPARVPGLEKLCREQTGVNSVACWKEIVHAVLVKVRNDPQQLVNFCETAPGETETRECIDHALGIIAASYNFDLSRMKQICEIRVEAPDFKSRCYPQLVASTLSTVPQEKPAAEKFCKSLEERYRESCYTQINNSLMRPASPGN